MFSRLPAWSYRSAGNKLTNTIIPAALPHAARNLPPMISFCLRRSDYFLVIEIIVIKYCLFVRRRHVGMADDADSKSVGRKPVWVQVPLPALFAKPRKSKIFSKIKGLRGFSLLTIFHKIKEIRALLRKICPKLYPKRYTKICHIGYNTR